MNPIWFNAVRASARAVAPWWLAGGAPEPVAVYQPIGAASLAASYVNLANPGTFDAAPGVAPTWASGTGWEFDGTTQYLMTGVVHAQGWLMIARITPQGWPLNQYAAGARSSTSTRLELGIGFSVSRNVFIVSHGGALVTGSGTNGTNYVLAATQGAGYIDGVTVGSPGAWDGTNTRAIAIGATNNDGTISNWWNGTVQAVAIYASSTDHAVWVPAVSAAMAAL